MKLYEFEGGLYPPRVGIYLAEKGISDVERIAFDMFKWPPPAMESLGPLGTVPILQTDDGRLIRSSMAIIEYLEELHPSPNMIGASPESRAQTRVLVSVVEEAATQFGIWVHKASPIFAKREPQNEVAAGFAAEAYHGRLRKLDLLAAENEGAFPIGSRRHDRRLCAHGDAAVCRRILRHSRACRLSEPRALVRDVLSSTQCPCASLSRSHRRSSAHGSFKLVDGRLNGSTEVRKAGLSVSLAIFRCRADR